MSSLAFMTKKLPFGQKIRAIYGNRLILYIITFIGDCQADFSVADGVKNKKQIINFAEKRWTLQTIYRIK